MINNSLKPYLCGAINGCTDDEAHNWRNDLLEVFPCAINPMIRDYRGTEMVNYREIVDLDKRDVRNCSCIVVNYVKPSVGTSMEILYGWMLGKAIIIWCTPDAKLSPWMIYHSTCVVHTLEEVVEKVELYS